MDYGYGSRNYAGLTATPADDPEPQRQIELQRRYEAEMKQYEMMESDQRIKASALEAALRCYPNILDHQKILLAARDFVDFLSERAE
jgi:hypothetical protein